MRKDYSKLIDEIQKKYETASEISIKSGIPESRIRNWLQKKAQPRKEDAEKLENLLKVTGKGKASEKEALDTNEMLAMLRVILGVLGEMEATRSGELPATVHRRIERAVEAERDALERGES